LLLANFKTIKEVKNFLPTITVVGINIPIVGIVPLHYGITDAHGASLVVEYTGGQLKMFDNNVRVLTNSPTYDWRSWDKIDLNK